MDELKEIADSAGDNFYGDVFIQLRHYLAKHNPGLLMDDDRQFKSPIRDLGITNEDHADQHHENVWKVTIRFVAFCNATTCSSFYICVINDWFPLDHELIILALLAQNCELFDVVVLILW